MGTKRTLQNQINGGMTSFLKDVIPFSCPVSQGQNIVAYSIFIAFFYIAAFFCFGLF